ncbi:MAG TPA: glycosyltransferase [Fimbriimonadaceae bacterium]|nr:glycosyltransferase [Fimbriimonadaceae bacterium]
MISVIIPTCHRNDLLAKCLDCLTPGKQTLDPYEYEVIVTDDGSQSTAEQFIREKYPWVKWTAGPKRGPAANRNHGARLASGEWIALTDDDCLPSAGWLNAFKSAMKLGTQVYEGRTTCEGGLPSPLFASPTNESGGYLWSCNMMISRVLFEELNGFDETFPFAAMEDVDFRDRIVATGHEFVFVPEAVIDHPPRPVPTARRRGEMTESEYVYFSRRGESMRKWPLIRQRAYIRLREIWRQPKGVDSIKAIPHLMGEIATIYRLFPKWEEQARRGR